MPIPTLTVPTLTVPGPGEPARLVVSSWRAGLAGRTALCDLRPSTGYTGAVAVLSRGPVVVRKFGRRHRGRLIPIRRCERYLEMIAGQRAGCVG